MIVCSIKFEAEDATLLWLLEICSANYVVHNRLANCSPHCRASEWKRKDFAFRRQFDEKLSIIPGCPGAIRKKPLNGIVASLIMLPSAIASLVATSRMLQLSYSHDSRTYRYPVGAMSTVSWRHAVIKGGMGLMRCCCCPCQALQIRDALALQEGRIARTLVTS